MSRKYRNHKKLQNTGKKSHKDHLIVCEDFENESDDEEESNEGGVSDSLKHQVRDNRRDRIK